ncbi:MAG: hypothetical protein ACI4MG_06205, partial [Aristaeellaceae bacterium]
GVPSSAAHPPAPPSDSRYQKEIDKLNQQLAENEARQKKAADDAKILRRKVQTAQRNMRTHLIIDRPATAEVIRLELLENNGLGDMLSKTDRMTRKKGAHTL